jgi:uncharacterized Zn finger protein (UPF0148 family)
MNCPKCGMPVRRKAITENGFIYDCGTYYIGTRSREQSDACKRIAELTEENRKLRIVIQRTFKSNFQSFDTAEELIGFMFEQLENE